VRELGQEIPKTNHAEKEKDPSWPEDLCFAAATPGKNVIAADK
jgi:hypothetical protein